MRKIICLIMILIFLIFMLPFIFANKQAVITSKETIIQKEELQPINYEYNKYAKRRKEISRRNC